MFRDPNPGALSLELGVKPVGVDRPEDRFSREKVGSGILLFEMDLFGETAGRDAVERLEPSL